MRSAISILLLAAMAIPQSAPKAQPPKRAPILGFAQSKDATPIMDIDMFNEQKYREEVGADTSRVNAMRAEHEAALTREFIDGFNDSKECDGVILQGKGDNKPDFAVQIIVDSHDMPAQKPLWVWALRNVHTNKLMSPESDATAKEASKNICLAVLKAAG